MCNSYAVMKLAPTIPGGGRSAPGGQNLDRGHSLLETVCKAWLDSVSASVCGRIRGLDTVSPWRWCTHRSVLILGDSSEHHSPVDVPVPTDANPGGDTMAITQIVPQSGVQLLMIIGAAFLMAGVQPNLGMMLLMLGVVTWAIYNLFNFGRQF